MDLPPPVQDPERREEADEPAEPAGRLAAVEAELIALGARLEQMEASLQEAVREETRRASNEIRHTVSELGRRLALDLPQFLDRHRQLIVGELRGTGGTGGGSSGGSPGGSDPGPVGAAGAEGGGTPGGGAAADTDDDPSSDDPGGGRPRKRRRRKDA